MACSGKIYSTDQIHLPPLRKRGLDILIIARRFLTQFIREENKPFGKFSLETEQLLQSYTCSGNIREKGERRPNSSGNASNERQDMLAKLRESIHILIKPSKQPC